MVRLLKNFETGNYCFVGDDDDSCVEFTPNWKWSSNLTDKNNKYVATVKAGACLLYERSSKRELIKFVDSIDINSDRLPLTFKDLYVNDVYKGKSYTIKHSTESAEYEIDGTDINVYFYFRTYDPPYWKPYDGEYVDKFLPRHCVQLSKEELKSFYSKLILIRNENYEKLSNKRQKILNAR